MIFRPFDAEVYSALGSWYLT